MAVSTANVSITLGAHEPKKASVVVLGVPTVAATDVAIWVGASVNQDLTHSKEKILSEDSESLKDYLLNKPTD